MSLQARSETPDSEDDIQPLLGYRKAYLPLARVTQCDGCGSQAEGGRGFPICGRCGERVYCNAKCQNKDWPKHKRNCGKTDRIDLHTFWPMIAVLMESDRLDDTRPSHPALTHLILNSPNPPPAKLGVLDVVYGPLPEESGGGSSRLVFLGDPVPLDYALSPLTKELWWPTAVSEEVRDAMIRRFINKGYILPSLVAITTALLGEMYTTTYVSEVDAFDYVMKRRKRLHYNKSPIRDFGIVKGKIMVPPMDFLAYIHLSEGSSDEITKIQDPNEHYWIYFTTLGGEDLILDCGLFGYNHCCYVDTAPYAKYGLNPGYTISPASFSPSDPAKGPKSNMDALIHQDQERFSVLRDEGLREAVKCELMPPFEGDKYARRDNARCLKLIYEFMDKVAGKRCSETERAIMKVSYEKAIEIMSMNLDAREYLQWPDKHEFIWDRSVVGRDEEPKFMGPDDLSPELEGYLLGWSKKKVDVPAPSVAA